MSDPDVVVAGAGAAGLAAAIEAVREGATALVLEKQPEAWAGGNTRVSGGVWFEHSDTAAAERYLRALCGPDGPADDVVRAWARETGRNTAWMRDLGASVEALPAHRDPEFPELDGSDCYRGYQAVDGAWGDGRLHTFLLDVARASGVEVRFEAEVEALVTGPGGEVCGVVAAGLGTVSARRGVVLACGGFAGAPDMLAEHLDLEEAAPWGSPHNVGDGHRLAASVGAPMSHMANHMRLLGTRLPVAAAGLPLHVPSGSGYAYVDLHGRRFVDEAARNCHGHVRVGGRYERFAAGPFWLLIDERARRGGPLSIPVERAPFGWTNRTGAYRWSDDNVRELDAGWITSAPTLAGLAERIGVRVDVLRTTVETYNLSARGAADPWGRDTGTMVPLDQPPFHAVRCTPTIAFTCGGPRRNGRAQVLGAGGRPIPRLHAAGELSATYSRCIDGGMMIADALAFGRVAGAEAAALDPGMITR